jgi:pilus assembly protein Flp/PilA
MNSLARFVNNESGATAIEYALVASLIAVVIAVAVNALGTNLNASYMSTSAALK